MWNFDPRILGEVALRTAIVYLVLLIMVRITGKRQIGQMTPFDLVVLLLLSNAVQNAMVGPDTSLTGGIVAAIVLLVSNRTVSMLRIRSPLVRELVEGVPSILIQHGEVMYRTLQQEQITLEELMANLREHECVSVTQVQLAMLE